MQVIKITTGMLGVITIMYPNKWESLQFTAPALLNHVRHWKKFENTQAFKDEYKWQDGDAQGKKKKEKRQTKQTTSLRLWKQLRGFYIDQAFLGERNWESRSSLLQRWEFFIMLLAILTVKERDKLNSEGCWFILLSALFNCTKETSAIALKKDKSNTLDMISLWLIHL